jgi:phosphohistidine phosphatase
VVAKRLEFASYFAQLLRHKTKQQQQQQQQQPGQPNIIKRYKCLVCLQQQGGSSSKQESVVQQWQRLHSLVNTTIRHYLEPSDRAPKRFESELPPMEKDGEENNNNRKEWLECLLQITNISSIYPIPTDQHPLAKQLWTSTLMPPSTKAVCEVSIQLETGRTHQIRGQLSKLGYPLVGDEQYGGAIPVEKSTETSTSNIIQQQQEQLLALQSSFIGFWDADYTVVWNRKRRTNITQGIPSDRWVEANLERAWWTPILEQQGHEDESITSMTDVKLLETIQSGSNPIQSSETSQSRSNGRENAQLLPPPVQLSPGRNKYVLVKVESSETGEIYWFVKSASPSESGGPYHANVAEDLVAWIQAAGFDKVTVTGGGRIDYDPSPNRAHVYGFSYGFGKGDHAQAAAMIAKAGILSTFDNSNALY